MADIATLGLAVDSRQVTSANRELDALARSANKAQIASNGLANAAQNGASAHRQSVSASAASRRELDAMANSAKKADDVFDRLGGRITSALSRRLLGAVVISQLAQVAQWAIGLNKTLADLADTADRAGLSLQRAQGLSAAAATKGVSGDAFNAAMLELGKNVDLAKMGMGDLLAQFRVAGKEVKNTDQVFNDLADMIAKAGTNTEKFAILQAAGLPATREMVKLFEQGSEKIKRQSEFAPKLTDQQIRDAQKVDEEFNAIWTNFERWGRKAVVTVYGAMRDLPAALGRMPYEQVVRNRGLDQLKQGRGDVITSNDLNKIYGFSKAFGPNSKADDEALSLNTLKNKNSQRQQELALLGSTTTAAEARKMVELQLQAASYNLLTIDKKRAEFLKQKAFDDNLGLTQLRAQTDAYKVEAETVGMSTGAAVAYAAATNLINQARRDGKELTAANVAAIQQEAEALGRAAQAAENFKFGNEVFKGFFQTLRQNLQAGTSAWDSFKNAGLSALDKIADKATDFASNQLFRGLFGTGSAGGGLLGSLFSGGVTASANGNVFGGGKVIPFASGGVVGGPTMAPMALFGEAGPEAIIPLKRGANGQLGVQSSGGTGKVAVTFNVVDNSSGAKNYTTEEQPDGRGGTTLTMTIDDAMVGVVGQAGTKTNRALRAGGFSPGIKKR